MKHPGTKCAPARAVPPRYPVGRSSACIAEVTSRVNIGAAHCNDPKDPVVGSDVGSCSDRTPACPVPHRYAVDGRAACCRKSATCIKVAHAIDGQRVHPIIHAGPQGAPARTVPLRHIVDCHPARMCKLAARVEIPACVGHHCHRGTIQPGAQCRPTRPVPLSNGVYRYRSCGRENPSDVNVCSRGSN